jgi:hypothetical protein
MDFGAKMNYRRYCGVGDCFGGCFRGRPYGRVSSYGFRSGEYIHLGYIYILLGKARTKARVPSLDVLLDTVF